MKDRQVDLPQLFTDVSRTVSGIRSMLGTSPEGIGEGEGRDSSPLNGMCFKACGMEDIQYAARAAGDLLHSARLCLLVSTTVIILCLLLFTSLSLFLFCRRYPPRSSSSIVHTLFPSSVKSSSSST